MTSSKTIFHTHGCRLNTYETEVMKHLATECGVKDAVVVNTCAVTAEAVRKARQDIRKLRRAHPQKPLIVTGCAAQTDPQAFSAMPEVDLVFGNQEKMRAETWRGLGAGAMGHDAPSVHVGDIMTAQDDVRRAPVDGFGTRARAYVQVQNGCDHRCTFCIIPFGRGNSRSIPADVVIDQIARLVDRGYNEIVLTGVDLTAWGADFPTHPKLGDLVQRILKHVPDLPRLRLSSIDSVEVDDMLMEALASEPRLMPHVHLSLQHGDNLILKRMKRRHTRDDAIALCETLRALRPDVVFGADIIAGFPTETAAAFEHSLRLVAECGLTWLHVFPYSKRNGTPAARMPQVGGATIKARAAQLRTLGMARAGAYLAGQVGVYHHVLMESPRKGRTPHFAQVVFEHDHPKGQIVTSRIQGFADHHLLA